MVRTERAPWCGTRPRAQLARSAAPSFVSSAATIRRRKLRNLRVGQRRLRALKRHANHQRKFPRRNLPAAKQIRRLDAAQFRNRQRANRLDHLRERARHRQAPAKNPARPPETAESARTSEQRPPPRRPPASAPAATPRRKCPAAASIDPQCAAPAGPRRQVAASDGRPCAECAQAHARRSPAGQPLPARRDCQANPPASSPMPSRSPFKSANVNSRALFVNRLLARQPRRAERQHHPLDRLAIPQRIRLANFKQPQIALPVIQIPLQRVDHADDRHSTASPTHLPRADSRSPRAPRPRHETAHRAAHPPAESPQFPDSPARSRARANDPAPPHAAIVAPAASREAAAAEICRSRSAARLLRSNRFRASRPAATTAAGIPTPPAATRRCRAARPCAPG